MHLRVPLIIIVINMNEQDILAGITEKSSFVEYFAAYKNLKNQPSSAPHKVKIAILSNFTIEPFDTVLSVACRKQGIAAEIMVAGFNQYSQQVLDSQSRFYSFKPEIVLFLLDGETLFGNIYHFPYRHKVDERKKQVEYQLSAIKSLLSHIQSQLSPIVVFNTLEVPFHSVLGMLEGKLEYGLAEMMRDFNSRLFALSAQNANTYVFDLDSWAALHGKEAVHDPKMKYLARMHISTEFYPDLAKYYVRYVKALKGFARKCIVVDLDDTLWGGIAGEDGKDGIQLGEDAPGNAYVEFQKVLLGFYERGVLLAINSKNNPDDAWDIILNHPKMVLRKEHFAAYRINWQDKATNMRELAAELNLGLSSFVFLDDSPEERFLVRKELPEIHVPELPADPSSYAHFLKAIGEFDTLQLTEEDRSRSALYSQKRQADDLQHQFTNMTDYLKALQLHCIIQPPSAYTMPRIAQLTQKTNQFNLTTKRYSLEEIKAMTASKKFMIDSYAVSDRFGDQGIVGVTIVKKAGQEWRIDAFLLSCRVLGREIEHVMITNILEQASSAGAERVVGMHIPTQKNAMVKDFYKSTGFSAAAETEGAENWVFTIGTKVAMPECVRVTRNE